MNKKNVISMSLYGGDPKYSEGVKHNAKLAKEHFPSWEFRVYTDNNLDLNVKNGLLDLGVNLITVNNKFMGMFWRFFVYDDPSVNRFIIRDADDRLNNHDRLIVDEWLKYDLPFHIIRSNSISHGIEILGGAWGGTANSIDGFSIIKEIEKYSNKTCIKFCDQYFLKDVLWPKIKNISLTHGYTYGYETHKHIPFNVEYPISLHLDNLKKIGIDVNQHDIPKNMFFYPIGEVYGNNIEKSFYE